MRATAIAALALLLIGCEPDAPFDPGGAPIEPVEDAAASGPAPLVPAAPTLNRLTRTQYLSAVTDLLGEGLTLPSTLEPDAVLDGLLTLGASETTISPRGVELYEEAAIKLATQAVESAEHRAAIAVCEPTGAYDTGCFEQIARAFGRRAWRRALTDDEAAALAGIATQAAGALGETDQGLVYLVAAALQSPHFLYRVERGAPDPDHPGSRRLTGYEVATRLALFLWNTIPDEALLAAAESGALDSRSGVEAQAARLLASERSRVAVRNFFSEWLHLAELADMKKDPTIFKHYSPDLAEAAREETLRLIEHVVLERDADVRELFTTRTAFVNPRLAAIYNVPAASLEGFARVELPEDGQRRGLLGQVSFLALNSHPTSSSATLRGVFLREALLCDPVPDPPSDLNTALPEPDSSAVTLRERLTVHMQDPFCASCHAMTDIPGLGFESFDGIGRFRLTEGGQMIDASGDLDGAAFSDFKGLAERVATSPKLAHCLTRKLFSYAVGHPLRGGEEGEVERLVEAFEASGRRVKALMLAIATSDGFLRVGEVE